MVDVRNGGLGLESGRGIIVVGALVGDGVSSVAGSAEVWLLSPMPRPGCEGDWNTSSYEDRDGAESSEMRRGGGLLWRTEPEAEYVDGIEALSSRLWWDGYDGFR